MLDNNMIVIKKLLRPVVASLAQPLQPRHLLNIPAYQFAFMQLF